MKRRMLRLLRLPHPWEAALGLKVYPSEGYNHVPVVYLLQLETNWVNLSLSQPRADHPRNGDGGPPAVITVTETGCSHPTASTASGAHYLAGPPPHSAREGHNQAKRAAGPAHDTLRHLLPVPSGAHRGPKPQPALTHASGRAEWGGAAALHGIGERPATVTRQDWGKAGPQRTGAEKTCLSPHCKRTPSITTICQEGRMGAGDGLAEDGEEQRNQPQGSARIAREEQLERHRALQGLGIADPI